MASLEESSKRVGIGVPSKLGFAKVPMVVGEAVGAIMDGDPGGDVTSCGKENENE